MAHEYDEIAEIANSMLKLAHSVKLETIEACAKIAERNMHSSIAPGHVGQTIAAEIRGLGRGTENGR